MEKISIDRAIQAMAINRFLVAELLIFKSEYNVSSKGQESAARGCCKLSGTASAAAS